MALPAPSDCIGSIRLLADDALVDTAGPAWRRFTQSWDDLPIDTHMADGGTYRRRRYAAFRLAGTDLQRLPHCAHFQERDHNPLNGGSPRWFAPMLPTVADGDTLRAIVRGTAARLEPAPAWQVEVHQFRIHADAAHPGLPTPEGMHRDGRDHVLIMLTGLANVRGGTTSIADPAGALLASIG